MLRHQFTAERLGKQRRNQSMNVRFGLGEPDFKFMDEVKKDFNASNDFNLFGSRGQKELKGSKLSKIDAGPCRSVNLCL